MLRGIRLILVFFLSLAAGLLSYAQDGLDSLKRQALSDKLDEYFTVLSHESVDVQKQECDFLIDSSTDSLVRQFVARKIYDHYIGSPLMGAEAVAIHVLDKWFIPGIVKMDNDIDLINARVYADFNRQSQIGMKAPELTMSGPDGVKANLFGDDSSSGRGFTVLYFYDTDCAKCRMESILLRNVMEDNDFPVNLYAVYSGDDQQAWEDYRTKQLAMQTVKARVNHLWDPELDSDFQRKYGVLQTPRMFLIRPDGVIMGRGLDTRALLTMLKGIFTEVELDYGSDESARLFDSILADSSGEIYPSAETVARLADHISETTLPKGDTVMFRQLSGDLLYYLSSRSGEGFKEGLAYLIDRNIGSRPYVWDTPDDSLKVIGFAQIMGDLLSKTEKGTQVPAIKVPGEYITSKKSKNLTKSLRKLKGERNIILFYTEGCHVCKAEKEALIKMVASDSEMRLFFVNVDRIMASDPDIAGTLFDKFDLTTLPFIIETDSDGRIVRRYLSYR